MGLRRDALPGADMLGRVLRGLTIHRTFRRDALPGADMLGRVLRGLTIHRTFRRKCTNAPMPLNSVRNNRVIGRRRLSCPIPLRPPPQHAFPAGVPS
jgi:hypothetical protein